MKETLVRTYLVQVFNEHEGRWYPASTEHNREDAGEICTAMWMHDVMYRKYRVISYPLAGPRDSHTTRVEDL